MRTETFELLKALKGYDYNPAAAHFADFIQHSEDKDQAADEVRKLIVDTAKQGARLVLDMGLVDVEELYTEEIKRVIDAARRMCNHIELEDGTVTGRIITGDEELPHNAIEALKLAVVEYEANVLGLHWLEERGDGGVEDVAR